MKIKCDKKIKKADIFITGVIGGKIQDTSLNNETKKEVEAALNSGIKGSVGDFYLLNNLKGDIKSVLLVWLSKDASNYKIREIGAKTYKYIDNCKQNENVIADKVLNEEMTSAFLEGFLDASYKFDKYKSKKKESSIKNVIFTDEKLKPYIEKSIVLSDSVKFAKDLINEQAHVMTPTHIAEIARNIADKNGFELKIFEKEELEKMNFGAFLAVARGSEQPPKLIHLSYKPKNPTKKIALIGKGITFDAGGLDIKPASSMLDMKDDMSGCACILGVIQALSKLKSNVEVHAISALCENMPSGRAYKQGDILKSKSGMTIEVDNTDAEGRLTLADVLTYADETGYDEIIDIATLTGACIVALGSRISGIMGTNKKMIDKIIKSGEKSGEDLWEMPIKEDMKDNLKSNIADVRNTGGREAGTSVAGWFLSNFIKNKNWAHIDIAGTAHISKPYREHDAGATGVMVKTLTNYLLDE